MRGIEELSIEFHDMHFTAAITDDDWKQWNELQTLMRQEQ